MFGNTIFDLPMSVKLGLILMATVYATWLAGELSGYNERIAKELYENATAMGAAYTAYVTNYNSN